MAEPDFHDHRWVVKRDLRLKPATLPLPLSSGAGLDLVCRAADTAGIAVTGLARGGMT